MNSSRSIEGYEDLITKLQTLITAYPPEFIFVHDQTTPRISFPVIRHCVESLHPPVELNVTSAFVDAVTCFTPRLFYDTVINALAKWTPRWEDGCKNWQGPSGSTSSRFNDSFDSFIHGLQALRAVVQNGPDPSGNRASTNGKGKSKAELRSENEYRILVFIERAERLKETLPDLVVPLVRLAELAQMEITTIFHSEVPWEQLRPPLGSSPDPHFIDVHPLSKQATLTRLESSYPAGVISPAFDPNTYHPALRPLYDHFLTTLYNICSPFTTDPDELQYIAAARWPGFVQPVLDEYQRYVTQLRDERRTARTAEFGGQPDEGDGEDQEQEDDADIPEISPPTEDTRMRLIRMFTPSFTSALEALYPRLTSASEWANTNKPPPNLLSEHPRYVSSLVSVQPLSTIPGQGLGSLPRIAKFILIASFLASTNPAKTDLRMFGRGLDERSKRKRRKAGTPRKTSSKSTAIKIPQRLVGPLAFPLDRMVAILGVLLEENDVEVRRPAPEFTIPGEYTEMEISRVVVFAQVMELASMHLLHRATPSDKLDPSSTFKCGITYEVALSIARDLEVPLNDLVWEPV